MLDLTPEECWLLDVVRIAPAPLRLMLPEVIDQSVQWNALSPPWTGDEMLIVMQRIAELGLIEFYLATPEDPAGKQIQSPKLNRRTVMAEARRKVDVYYSLTPFGGEIWETIAQPKWTKFYWSRVLDRSSGSCMRKAEQGLICKVIAGDEHHARLALFWTVISHNLLTLPGTERYTAIGEWEATYWKKLSHGVQGEALAVEGSEYHPLENCLTDDDIPLYRESSTAFDGWFTPARNDEWKIEPQKRPRSHGR